MSKYGVGQMTMSGNHQAGSEFGSFFVVFPEKAVELSFGIGSSGVTEWNTEDFPTDKETFVQGLVVMVVEKLLAATSWPRQEPRGCLLISTPETYWS